MKLQVIKTEDGLAVMIPSSVAMDLALEEGSHVEVRHVSEPIDIGHRITDPTAETTSDGIHRETYWGEPAGREVLNG